MVRLNHVFILLLYTCLVSFSPPYKFLIKLLWVCIFNILPVTNFKNLSDVIEMMVLYQRSFENRSEYLYFSTSVIQLLLTEQILCINAALAQSIHHDCLFLLLYILLNDINHWIHKMTNDEAGIIGILLTKEFFNLWPHSFCFLVIPNSRADKQRESNRSDCRNTI